MLTVLAMVLPSPYAPMAIIVGVTAFVIAICYNPRYWYRRMAGCVVGAYLALPLLQMSAKLNAHIQGLGSVKQFSNWRMVLSGGVGME